MVKFFTKEEEREIVDAIRRAEARTSGEIRVHLKRKCKGDALEEAKKVFKRLGMQRTKQRNAVLIFVAPESRAFAVLGDEGIHRIVSDEFWRQTRDLMLSYFSKNLMKDGITAGIESAGEKLKKYFPADPAGRNELKDTVTED